MGEIGENILNLKYIYYSPRIIFFNRVNSSNISSLSELKPPPGWAAVAGAAEVFDGVPGALGAAGGPGLFANVGVFAAGAAEGSPDPGVGGSFGAGGKSPARLGGPPPEGALGGPPPGGALGGPPPGGALGGPPPEGALGGPPLAAAGVALGAAAAEAATVSSAPPDPLNKVYNVLAAAVLAAPVVGVAILAEEVLTV